MQRALPQGQVILPRSMILIRISLRQVFCTLQVTSPVAGLWLCRVEQSATAHALRVSRSFFSSSVSGALDRRSLGLLRPARQPAGAHQDRQRGQTPAMQVRDRPWPCSPLMPSCGFDRYDRFSPTKRPEI